MVWLGVILFILGMFALMADSDSARRVQESMEHARLWG